MTFLMLGAACVAFLVLLLVTKMMGADDEPLTRRLVSVGAAAVLAAVVVGLVYLLVRDEVHALVELWRAEARGALIGRDFNG